jgi:hypothetical protein
VPRIVKTFGVNGPRGVAVWDGLINGLPAPAGTYLVGITVTDQACNLGQWPIVNPPPPGSTPHAGVTVRYVSAVAPLAPVGAGSIAAVSVHAPPGRYGWTLWRVGRRRPMSSGSGLGRSSGARTLPIRIPALGAGLYELVLHAGAHRAVVPIIASAQGRRAGARVLVVLPALSWQGLNPVDGTGDGLPATLAAGDRIELLRPLLSATVPGIANEAALLAYLDAHHLPYQLTSDLALASGRGPRLRGHSGVILDGALTWMPRRLGPALLAFTGNGGRLVSLGQSSMLRSAAITPSSAGPIAGPPGAPAKSDPFGARPGPHVSASGALVTVIADPLAIFGLTGGALTGVQGYQVIAPPAGTNASLAGIDATMPGVSGFRIGRGMVVEVGLDGYQRSLARNTSSQELLARLWQTLSG